MTKSCGISNFNVDASPNLLPRPEKSSVRADMNKAMQDMKVRRALRKETGAAVTDAERKMALTPRPAPTKPVSKDSKKFDSAVQHPVFRNLGL